MALETALATPLMDAEKSCLNLSKSILSISFITRVAVSEKLSMSDGAGGISGWTGLHDIFGVGATLSEAKSISILERPVTPEDDTIA